MPYAQFANPETNLFPRLSKRFETKPDLSPFELWAILKWKANRATTHHLKRLITMHGSFGKAAQSIGHAIFDAADPDEKLKAAMEAGGFRLATASALLTVLYPDTFTVYDVRVCDEMKRFHELRYRRFSTDLWNQYAAFKAAVIAATPCASTLREADRYLWGKSWIKDAETDLGEVFSQGTTP